jgi:hypothetical protein
MLWTFSRQAQSLPFTNHQLSMKKRSSTRCTICSKPLTDAISVELGIGPECRRKTKGEPDQQANMFGGPVYTYELLDGGLVLSIIDNATYERTVTNAIEYVLATIKKELGDIPPHVMYRDSYGVWDGVAVSKAGTFQGFFALSEATPARAKAKLLNYNRNHQKR